MRIFNCPVCSSNLYFDNDACTACGTVVGFDSQQAAFVAMPAVDQNATTETAPAIVFCANHSACGCNWVVPGVGNAPFCVSCRLNEIIPPIADPDQRRRWANVEAAKRRLIYSFLAFGLDVRPKTEIDNGLSFRILVDQEHGGAGNVVMGHESGVITIDATEADAHQREFRREELDEGYRTLLGHMRHESGHYVWELLSQIDGFLPEYRALFGDEREDYQEALKRHYENGAPAGWQANHVSAYATCHSWEDWAETFAHYLHIVDGVETAQAYGLSGQKIAARTMGTPVPATTSEPDDPHHNTDFNPVFESWMGLSILMNSMNRSLGHGDYYPFVLPEPVRGKLEFVHRWMETLRDRDLSQLQPSQADQREHSIG